MGAVGAFSVSVRVDAHVVVRKLTSGMDPHALVLGEKSVCR